MRSLVFRIALLATVLAGAARASDFVVPPGYNLETLPSASPAVGVMLDGRMLVSTGSFLADELSILHSDGTTTLFATGFGSLAGAAQSPVTGDIVVGDSEFTPSLWILRDLNNDGDALDTDEMVPHPVQPIVLNNGLAPLPFDLQFKPGTDELYMSASTSAPVLGVVTRTASGVMTIYADGLGYPADMVWDGDDLYVADLALDFSSGRVLALTDGNGDDDALDADEAVEFASGLSGANGLVQAADGSFYVSGLFCSLGSCIGRLLPDGNGDGVTDGIVEAYFDGFAFAAGMLLFEGPGGFGPGSASDGRLVVVDFTFPTPTVRHMRSAPVASTKVIGPVANNAQFDIVVSGHAGGFGLAILSLDTAGATITGIGDFCTGFDGPYIITPPQLIGPSGSVATTIVVHNQPALVGLDLVIQGVVMRDGDYGIGNALDFIIGS